MGNPTVTPLVETFHDGGFIVSVANGHRSFEQIVLTGGKYLAGSVLGRITASGKYTQLNTGASDGSQNAAAILVATKDATAADRPAAIVARQAEVNATELIWPVGINGTQQAAATAALAALGILLRP